MQMRYMGLLSRLMSLAHTMYTFSATRRDQRLKQQQGRNASLRKAYIKTLDPVYSAMHSAIVIEHVVVLSCSPIPKIKRPAGCAR
jgi:hypothetical protein